MPKTWLSEKIREMHLGVKIKAGFLGDIKVFAGVDPISGSTSGYAYGLVGANNGATTLYSEEIDVTDYSSVTVSGSIGGGSKDNNLGNGGCLYRIGLQGAINKSTENTGYGGNTVTVGANATWDLTEVVGKVRVYCYFTCYSADNSGAGQCYSQATVRWTFNP